MRLQLLLLNLSKTPLLYKEARLKNPFRSAIFTAIVLMFQGMAFAQGTWTPIATLSPNTNGGGMLLLSDGSVLCKSFGGGGDAIGNIYDKLTPDQNGNYVNGTWSSIAPMNKTRLYYSSQVLKDGRVYVCGGEYGSGGSLGETYDPLTNVWTLAGTIGTFVSDANSEIFEDGKVMQAYVSGDLKGTKIYDPTTNLYTDGPSCLGVHNESTWLKLADGSWMMVDRGTRNSERFIPSLNQWVADDKLPADLYDGCGLEFGTAILLPDGRSYWVGATGKTAIYTPSGNSNPGRWAAAADLPNNQGQPDASGALMVDGKILLATSPRPSGCNVFQTPTSYYVYDYIANSYTRITSPDGDSTDAVPCYYSGMLCLPNGQILYSLQYSNQYYVFTPGGPQLNKRRPKIQSFSKITNKKYMLTGTGFNGNSEGAVYGDDWQMNTNYPIISLVDTAGNVNYARTYNWNSTGVMRGKLPDTVYFAPPKNARHGSYTLYVSANGIHSDPFLVNASPDPIAELTVVNSFGVRSVPDVISNSMKVYPNPVKDQATIEFSLSGTTQVNLRLFEMNGKQVRSLFDGRLSYGDHSMQLNLGGLSAGVYVVRLITENGIQNLKLTKQ